jgi:hypothetical protein
MKKGIIHRGAGEKLGAETQQAKTKNINQKLNSFL